MNDISDAVDLMATAREALNELLPSLPKNHRYAGLMIANAIAIAIREHGSGHDAERGENERLCNLVADLDPDARPRSPEAPCGELPVLRRALAMAIRHGYFDDPLQQRALRTHLARTASDWVAISNPKALRDVGVA